MEVSWYWSSSPFRLSSMSIRLEASSASAGGSSGSESPDAVASSMDTRGTLSRVRGETASLGDFLCNAVSGRSSSCICLSVVFSPPLGLFLM